MSNNNLQQRPGCGSRLAWIAKAVFTFLLVVGVLVAIVGGSYTIYQMVQGEIDRSSGSVATRFEAQDSRIDILRQEVNALVAANPDQEDMLTQLQQELTAVNSQLSNLDSDLSKQNTVLATLEASMATTLSNDESAAGGIVVLNNSLAALQGDFNSASMRLDTFGGEVDGLVGEVALLDETAITAQEQALKSETAVSDMAQTLMLFRAWELVARARLRLLENNVGLAQADIESADNVLRVLILTLPEASEEADAYQTVQTRLALATDNLTFDATIAGADLETAWDVLDKILAARLLPEGEALELGLGEALETAVPVPFATEPVSTPQSPATVIFETTPTPEFSPTPEASPTP
jgi:hypothetical protein